MKMQLRYLSIWRLWGANALPDSSSIELARLTEPDTTAILTTKPDPYFLHIDLQSTIGEQLLRGLFGPKRKGTPEERIEAGLTSRRADRAKQDRQYAYVVVEGDRDVSPPKIEHRNDLEKFSVCFDAIDRLKIHELFHPHEKAILAALSVSLPVNVDNQIEKMGAVSYLIDPTNNKPLYSLSFKFGSGRASLSSPLKCENIAKATARTIQLVSSPQLSRPIDLLATSINTKVDPLQGFIAAWSALEIFIHSSFKSTYESRWYDLMAASAPNSAADVFKRLKVVMKDKYRVTDKFMIIATTLDPNSADIDAVEFGNIKQVRNDLLHGLATPEHLPTEKIQRLLTKYLALHLDGTAQ